MAIPAQAQNWTSTTMQKADDMLTLRSYLELHAARALINSLTTVLTNAELTASPSFAHLTQTELTDVYTVFTDYLTFMGDPKDPATRAGKLAKMAG